MAWLASRKRLVATFAVFGLCLVLASAAGSTVAAPSAIRFLKEYPFTAVVTWTIHDTFTTQCVGQRSDGSSLSGTVTATMSLTGAPLKAGEALWTRVSGRAAEGRLPFPVRLGRELSTVHTSVSIPPSCAPLTTNPNECAGTIKDYSSAVGELNPTTLDLSQPHNDTKVRTGTPPGAQMFCFVPSQVKYPTDYLAGRPSWWPAYYPIFDPKLNTQVTLPDPAGIYDCARRHLTTSFSDSYATTDSYDGYSETQQATATVKLTRILESQHRNAHLLGIGYPPQYAKAKPVYGC